MGLFSFLSKPKDPRDECAKRIALESGVLSECPVCRDIVDARAGDAAWKKAESLATTATNCGDNAELMKRVRRQVDQADINCICDNDG